METETPPRPDEPWEDLPGTRLAWSDADLDAEADEAPVRGTRALRYERRTQARWLFAVVVGLTLLAGGLRFYRLSDPKDYIFDEVYYAKDGCLDAGYPYQECDLEADREQTVTVHPPLGRELIGRGIVVFGNREFGWRVAAAVFGTLTIPLVALLAYLLFDSVLWAGAAGLLLATEGLNFVQSRISMLDIFIATFVVAGFLFLVLDRKWIERRTPPPERLTPEEREETLLLDLPPDRPPSPIFRPWRIAAGIVLGAAASVKWSGGTALVVAILLTIGWERARRARVGIPRSLWETIRAEGFGILVFLVILPLAVYVATYFRWFGDHGGFLDAQAIGEWWDLQAGMAKFSLTLAAEHPYASRPWSWPLLMRPVAYYYKDGSPPGTAAEILGMGNPAVFWGGTVALITAAYYWLRSLGRRRVVQVTLWAAGTVAVAAGLVVLARWRGSELNFLDGRELPYALFLFGGAFFAVATVSKQERDWVPAFIAAVFFGQYLPWFGTFRTSFLFYMTPVTPFMVLAAVWGLKKVADVRLGPTRSRSLAPLAVAGVVLSVVLFVWFFPILTGRTISQDQWHLRIWFAFPGWWNWI